MSIRRLLLLAGVMIVSGCQYHVQQHADQALCELTAHPFDVGPPLEAEPPAPAASPAARPPTTLVPDMPTDVQTTALLQADKVPPEIVTRQQRLKIPESVPGSETPPTILPKDPAERKAYIERLFPPLPPLPEGPTPLPGPDGCPYTLAALQSIAAANSPTLRQAAANVEQARGNYIQAKAYPNPTVGYQFSPSNNGETPGTQGPFVDQVIQTGGKLKLAAAAAEMDLKNAELALKRARSDLSTNVRNAYYAVLVAKETVRVNRGLARFTDEVYLIQAEMLILGGFAAPYEPAALRAQAYTNRLALKQAIQAYIYSWKQLVATVGLRQLPLSEVAGRIDRAIPFYDYDTVLAHALHCHTDMLTAYNGIDKARYLLKAAQVTPIPNFEFNVAVQKEYAVVPRQIIPPSTFSFTLPIWDQNKGAIMAAEAALVTASEEPHRVETVITNNLAAAYMNYKNNLDALEYYRRFILPDQVRYYRGIWRRRDVDINAAFGDLVQAQQTLATNVQTYLGILSSLWTSVVSVADLLQTDDLFQLGHPQEVPELPDLDHQPQWMCHHPCDVVLAPAGEHGLPAPVPTPDAGQPLPAPRPVNPPAPPQPGGQPSAAVPGKLPEPLVTPSPTDAK